MSESSVIRRNDYTGNDSTATYAYGFFIDLTSELLVTVRNTTTDVESTLTLTTDYTVTGNGDVGGGNIVLVDASQAWISASSYLDTGYVLTVRRNFALTQGTDFRNQGDFFPESHEDAFDRVMRIFQQMQDQIDRCVKMQETSDDTYFNPEVPSTILGESQVTLATDATGLFLEKGPSVAEISAAAAYAASILPLVPAITATQTIAASGEIAPSTSNLNQHLKVVGDSAAVTCDATPFSSAAADGAVIRVRGTDNTNTVEVTHNDAAGGCILNGNAVLGENDMLTLQYDETADRYIEIGRNF